MVSEYHLTYIFWYTGFQSKVFTVHMLCNLHYSDPQFQEYRSNLGHLMGHNLQNEQNSWLTWMGCWVRTSNNWVVMTRFMTVGHRQKVWGPPPSYCMWIWYFRSFITLGLKARFQLAVTVYSLQLGHFKPPWPTMWEIIMSQGENTQKMIKRMKANWIRHILHRTCLLKHSTERKTKGSI